MDERDKIESLQDSETHLHEVANCMKDNGTHGQVVDQCPCSGISTPAETIKSESEAHAGVSIPRMAVSSGDCPSLLPNLQSEVLQSFVRAVHEKYNEDAIAVPDDTDSIVLVPKTGPVKLTASGNIVLPKQVSMSGCEISVAGDPVLIQKMCQKVRELDLMENNISSWEEIFTIIECIPHLTFLNITKNQLTSNLPDLTGRTLPKLTHLVLNNTLITWDVLLKLLDIFPSLEELHLSLNGFHSVELPSSSLHSSMVLTPPSTPSSDILMISSDSISTSQSSAASATMAACPSLQKLFFIGNKVTDWTEISKLGTFFPNLTFLLLSETDIKTLDGADHAGECFPHLQILGLNRTLIESWEEVEKLRLFPSLTDIRLSGIPFLEAMPEMFRRQRTIALLPNITHLNGSRIGETEREDAERAYIRFFLDKGEKPARYHELVKLHGKVDPLAKVVLKPRTHIRVKIRVEDMNQQVLKSEELDVDVTQSVRDLKKVVSNIAGRPASKFHLYYDDKQINMGPDKLRFMDRKLFSYNMTEGDEIIVECLD
ncbi:tubulin-specific chaperone cofactor E-like protein [Biomphalaria glabrata]|uniref:Tubulin-specific chaperone cofactor E-like protein n=1 Tax=Biomphalaria glabrata TaxID=6526 RepID=A0A9W2YV78_BIOGL|nr:tubulin-specific chaperone cofactor E-like protein [Biomphalaria glabrata]